MAFPVRGKTAIVTGAGSGINLCFAKLLLERGCNVLFADLTLRPEAEAVLQAHSSPKDSKKGRAIFHRTDVSQWKDLEHMFDVAEKRFGAVDIVVPGAGVYEPSWSSFWYPPGSAQSRDPDEGNHYKQLDINLSHPIRCTQLAISHFLANKKSGHVLHLSSIAGQLPNPVAPIYVATKHAISGFVRSLAGLEKQKNIRVTAIAPGVIKTPLWTEVPENIKNIDPLHDEWATPEEVALAMLDLIEKDECSVGKIEGGTVLEVGKNQTRLVRPRNDPGPSGPGHTVQGNRESFLEIANGMEPGWGSVRSKL